jgi:hypothetical protein
MVNWLRAVTEAALVAAHYQLDNLIIINDKNSLQLAGPTKEIMNTDPLDENGAPSACRLPSVTVTIWPTWWRRWRDCSLPGNRML